MYSSNKMNRFLPLVLVTLVLLLSSCSERSEYGEASDYEKLGAVSTDTTAPTISSLSPTDNSTYNSPATTVAVTFSNKMATGSVTTNTSDTSCSGSYQLSSDNFTTCIKMSATPSASDNDTAFTATPADNLSNGTTFKLRITTSAKDTSSNSLASTYTTNGFTTSPSGTGTIKGSVKVDNGSALSGVSVAFSIYGATVATATSDSNGDFSQSSLGLGVYSLTYTKNDYLTSSQSDTLASDNQTLLVETMTQLTDSCSSGTISGKITDAVDGSNVSSVVLSAYKGATFIKSTTTNDSGEYSFSDMDPGRYAFYNLKSGYISEWFYVNACGSKEDQDNSITTTLPSDTMRIILRWPKTAPETAQDLDSYLYSPDGSGDWHKIYWNNLVQDYGADGTVTLDKDDKEPNVPPGDETNTISKVRSGTYIYKVYNYSDSAANTPAKKTNLKNSKAMVKVYYNEGTCCTKKKYYVPNDNGTLWGVFTFNKDTGFTASDNMTTANP
ncbi:MAG TPA: hypothetical protein EYO28_08620 [Candidatus Lambdaproteobacteria bacterium]|nr:hypothetical protein [Candidatus Lambdaproteobacteria bacterium]